MVVNVLCFVGICQFGRAHVDTPLGDLDASGGPLTGGAHTTESYDAAFVDNYLVARGSDMYPYGAYEKYPRMEDTDNVLTPDSAHDYRECSNKGLCDRSTGTCECFPGYDGSACQRASCPSSSNGVCSGHGTCKTIQELASEDFGNVYRLWDEDVTMGCDCDAGYSGPDCSSRVCKYGADPLYYDDFQNTRFANFTLTFYMETNADMAYGNYSLIFTDRSGEDWQTDPIDIDAPCSVMQDRLESLPNNVIPTGSVLCSKTRVPMHKVAADGNTGQDASGHFGHETGNDVNGYVLAENGQIFDSEMLIISSYILAFPGNPGEIAPLKVNKYLDGNRPTLFTTETTATGTSTLGWHIYPNGYTGEDTDYVNDECEGVLVTLSEDGDGTNGVQSYLNTGGTEQDKLLKKCLGDSNGIAGDNVDVEDWDWGSWTNPHLIKLVDATQDAYVEYLRADGSSYKMLIHGKIASSAWDGVDYWVDNANADYPISTLCNNGAAYLNHKHDIDLPMSTDTAGSRFADATASADGLLGTWGFCKALNPPGFFAVIYYDDCVDVSGKSITAATGLTSSANTCSASNPWRVITNVNAHYGDSNLGAKTKFHVFTTKGTLQQVSQFAGIHTVRDSMTSTQRLASYHSNVVYSQNMSSANQVQNDYGGMGEMDCETNLDLASLMGPGASGQQGLLDCLRKDDKVMFLNLGQKVDALDTNCIGSDPITNTNGVNNIAGISYAPSDRLSCGFIPSKASFLSNPPALNMYTVKKIGEDPPSIDAATLMTAHTGDNVVDRDRYTAAGVQTDDEGSAGSAGGPSAAVAASHEEYSFYRRRIILDYGMNANYQRSAAGSVTDTPKSQGDTPETPLADSPAVVYKFYPPTLATTGTTGRTYVGECSNRGICDGDSGLCQCFTGYSGDNCGTVSSLVQ